MPTYYVSLSVSPTPGVEDEALIRVLNAAAKHAGCVTIEVTPRGLIVEAEAASVAMLEDEIRAVLAPYDAKVERIAIREI